MNAPPKEKDAILSLKDISKSFDNKLIVDHVSMTVEEGEFLTILGPSGCGKTTVLRLIAGLEHPNSGRIFLENEDITSLSAEHRKINTVFQNYALFPHMTIFDNVAFGLRMQNCPNAEITTRVFNVLKMVQLDHLATRFPAQLSGGQQQRVAIARAVINKPKVLLLDESLSALDYKLRQQMQLELKQLQRKLGITFIFVTHDQEEALSMSDRIIVMKNGVIEQEGTPKEIYEEPINLYVAKFIGEINIFPAQPIKRINDTHILASIYGCQFTLKTDLDISHHTKLNVLLRPEDLRLDELKEDENATGLIGHVIDRTYKGMTLDSIIELSNNEQIKVSEFFNEDDPDVDHSLNQKVSLSWVENWEVVLPYEHT